MEWVEKYKPNKLSECFNTQLVEKIRWWLDNWESYNESLMTNSLLLIGPSGVGKTWIAKLLFDEYKFNKVVECNANLVRTYSALTKTINSTLETSGIYKLISKKEKKKVAIIMDEIEGITLGDKGCMKKVLELIFIKNKEKRNIRSKCPVINICSSLENSKVTQIKKHSTIINVKYPNSDELKYLANKIFEGENCHFLSDDVLEYIINLRSYDYRSFFFFLRELFVIYNKNNIVTCQDINRILGNSFDKRHDLDMYQVTRKIINQDNISYDFISDAYKSYQSVIPYIMYDNFKSALIYTPKNNIERIDDIVNYYDDVSLGNIFEHYIYDEQMWELGDFASIIFFKKVNLLSNKNRIKMERLNYSTILNKLSKILYNHKLTKKLMDKLELENYNLTNIGSMFLESLFFEEQDELLAEPIRFLKEREIVQMDMDKLVKFNLFIKEYEERYNKIYKRKLKNMLEGKKRKTKKTTKKVKKTKKTKKTTKKKEKKSSK